MCTHRCLAPVVVSYLKMKSVAPCRSVLICATLLIVFMNFASAQQLDLNASLNARMNAIEARIQTMNSQLLNYNHSVGGSWINRMTAALAEHWGGAEESIQRSLGLQHELHYALLPEIRTQLQRGNTQRAETLMIQAESQLARANQEFREFFSRLEPGAQTASVMVPITAAAGIICGLQAAPEILPALSSLASELQTPLGISVLIHLGLLGGAVATLPEGGSPRQQTLPNSEAQGLAMAQRRAQQSQQSQRSVRAPSVIDTDITTTGPSLAQADSPEGDHSSGPAVNNIDGPAGSRRRPRTHGATQHNDEDAVRHSANRARTGTTDTEQAQPPLSEDEQRILNEYNNSSENRPAVTRPEAELTRNIEQALRDWQQNHDSAAAARLAPLYLERETARRHLTRSQQESLAQNWQLHLNAMRRQISHDGLSAGQP